MNEGAIIELMPLVALPAALPGTAQYTAPPVPQNLVVYVRGITFSNSDTVLRSVTIHQVSLPTDSPSASNILFPAVAINGKTKCAEGYYRGEWVIPVGGRLFMFCSAASVVNVKLDGELVQ
jgi:hypothetical protein